MFSDSVMNTNKDAGSLNLRQVAPKFSRRVQEILNLGEKIELSLPADLSMEGYYQACALFVTNQRLISFDTSHLEGIREVPLIDIKYAEVERMYGNSIFKVITKDGIIQLNRFSNTVSDLFNDACEFINSKEEIDKKGTKSSHRGSNKQRCPECGRVLRRRMSVCPFCIDKRKVLIRLLGYIKPYWKVAVIGLVCSILVTATELVPPYLTKTLIDEVVLKKDLQFLWTIVGALLFLYVAGGLFGGFRNYLLRYLAQHIVFDLRKETFTKLQSLSIAYYDKRSTGAIMSRVSNDTQQLQGFIIQATQDALIQIITLVGIGVIMFSMDWKLAALTLLPVPFVVIVSKIFAEKIHPIYHRVWRRRSRMNAILADSIPGVRVIKAFTGEDHEIKRFTNQIKQFMEERLRVGRMISVFRPSISFLVTLGGLIIWGLGGYWVITQPERLTLGTLVAFINYMWRFYIPVRFLADMSDSLQQAVTAAERVFEILDATPEPQGQSGMILKDIKGQLEFRDVAFYYEKGVDVLEDINLRIKPGETIGLVGPTGSGKSTIANLLMRYYEPTEGEILLDGIDIRDINLNSWRSQIGIVLQEPLLFRDTIANNIAYGKPDATMEEIIESAKIANAHDFISHLPDGYDTRLGERGIGLSGGERQRISIARAVIKDPRIIILDEATSAVDTQTEKLIQEAIERLIENRTTIIIAHRLSTLRKAHRIVVMEDGRIVEIGTHDQLMNKKGSFYRMVQMQADMGTDMLKV